MSILLCVFVASFSFISPVKAQDPLRVVIPTNGKLFQDEGYYAIWGEVENRGDVPAGSISITATYKEAEGFNLGIWVTDLMLPVVHPGEIVPFEILVSDAWIDEIADYTLDLTWSPTDALPTGLEIVSNSSSVAGGVMNVNGEIQNIGTEPTTGITVAAAFYDASGLVVATASSASIAGPFNPGENATFNIALEYTDLVPEVQSYSLIAQSQEYAVIPEFPIWTSMLLILIMLTVATAISKRRLLRTPIH